MTLEAKFKPAVLRSTLFILAGFLWSVAGIILCSYAIRWMMDVEWDRELEFGFLGLVLAAGFYQWGFKFIVKKNLARLRALPERPCLFAFASWKSYILIAVMVTLGIALRQSTIPKYDLSIPYEAMGGALLMGSIHYYLSWWRLVKEKNFRSSG